MSGIFVQRFGVFEGLARRFLVLSMAVGFAALLIAGAAAAWVTARTAEHSRSVSHTYQVEVSIGRLRGLIEETETTRRGYLLTGISTYLRSHLKAGAEIAPTIGQLAALTSDNPRQVARVADLRRRLAGVEEQQKLTVDLVRVGQRDRAIAGFTQDSYARRMLGIRDGLSTMLAEEHELLQQRDAAEQASLRAFYTILGVTGLLILLVALTSLATVLRYTRDLSSARDRLQILNTDLEGAVVERTADLTRANDEIQRFAYIVSHDLRSPLVNVMGFTAELDGARAALAELLERAEADAPAIVTEEARLAAREDLPEAIGFIRTSTQKMDRLINAILKLSREGRRVLVPEKIMLVDIAGGIRDSLRHLTDERGAEIAVDAPMPDLVSDRLAIEQILSNLVENAVKYLSPDRPGRIVVHGRTMAGRVIVEVVDNGRGIAASDHSRVFDLFRRAGQQDQPGEGIGLAHVRALAYRLGGTIDVTSTLGEGSIFRVSLPTFLPDTGPTS